jgi:hypothetical protein
LQRIDIGCYYKGNISTVFSGKNSTLLASKTQLTGTATASTKIWSIRPQATYVNGGQLGPGMNGTNGTLTLVMPNEGVRVARGWGRGVVVALVVGMMLGVVV